MSVDFDAEIAWIGTPTEDGRTLLLPDGQEVPVRTLPLPVIALHGGHAEVVGETREVFLDGPIVRARGHIWVHAPARRVAKALEAGRTLPCGVNLLPVGGPAATLTPGDDGGGILFDWVIAGLAVYLDDTRPAWPQACMRASAR